MITTRQRPELAAYRLGYLERIPCVEPDPFEGWPAYAEHMAHDMRSVRLGDVLVCVFGYFATSTNEVEAFAVLDRTASAGHGREIAAIIRAMTFRWMDYSGFRVAHATCSSNDRQAQVFLRAIGYRRDPDEDQDTASFTFRRDSHGQETTTQDLGPAGVA